MINEQLIKNVEEHGTFRANWQAKETVLQDTGFPIGKRADYAIIVGCAQPESMPGPLQSLKSLLDRLQISHTLLDKEYCCGWMPFGQPAVMAKNEDDIARSKALSRQFILGNFQQAKSLGAKAIVLFCAACEPSYANLASESPVPVISYSDLLERYFPAGKLEMSIDYYPGCYRFRRRITSQAVDLSPARRLLDKIEGLKVGEPDSNLCCYIPPQMEQLQSSFTSKDIVAICTGCYHNMRRSLQDRPDYRVWMLPEILLKALPV